MPQQDSVIALLYHQKIPSVTIKLIRSFVDISSIDIEDGANENDDGSDDFVPVADVANVLGDILHNLIQKPQAFRRFVAEDNLFVLIRAFLSKPLGKISGAFSEHDAVADPRLDLKWKKRYNLR
jgi:hypothetical protein